VGEQGDGAMSETRQVLLDMAANVFAERFSDRDRRAMFEGEWLADKWTVLEELGLPLALAGEKAGGFEVADGLALVGLVARHALPLPLAESLFANHLLARAGLAVAGGPLSIAPTAPSDRLSLIRDRAGWSVDGVARSVPWARHVDTIVVVATDGPRPFVAKVPRGGWIVEETAESIAGVPGDRVRFKAALSPDELAPLPDHLPRELVLSGGAALRSIGMAAAMRRILECTVEYVSERVQFGRPLGKFQVVQHDVAKIAAQTAAAAAAGDLAAEALANDFDETPIAVAKARAGEAAGIVAGLAHQLHGAIGVTAEYRLHYLTKQLWAWRDEFGGESYWRARLGRRALAAGGPGLWPTVTMV
jgi:acyl-CoA dehydrogenase